MQGQGILRNKTPPNLVLLIYFYFRQALASCDDSSLCDAHSQALPFSMSIGAVHDFIAKGSSELEIIYRVRAKPPARSGVSTTTA